MKNLKDQNVPQRKYLRKDTDNLNRQAKILSTLLEYGQQNILLTNILNKQSTQTTSSSSLAKSAGLKQQDAKNQQNDINDQEEINLKKIINEMSEADKKQVKKQRNK